jgi:hypothetical protein
MTHWREVARPDCIAVLGGWKILTCMALLLPLAPVFLVIRGA